MGISSRISKKAEEMAELLGEDEDITAEITRKKMQMRHCGVPMFRRLFAEFMGSFSLVIYITGAEIADCIAYGEDATAGSDVKIAFTAGFIVFITAFIFGPISGAHLSPGITLGFVLRGVFPWVLLPYYFLAQLSGGLLASYVLYATFGPVKDLGATVPLEGYTGAAVIMEIITSTFLMLMAFVEAKHGKIEGLTAALAVGFTVVAGVMFSGLTSGGSMNPVESLSPAIILAITGNSLHPIRNVWVYIVGPVVGTFIATVIMYILAPTRHPDEVSEAAGAALYVGNEANNMAKEKPSENNEKSVNNDQEIQ